MEASGFFNKQIAEAITLFLFFLFAVKAFTQYLRNYFEIYRNDSIVMLCAL